MPNRQNMPDQNQNQKGRNPADLQLDDDESSDLDPVRADQQPLSEEQRQALGQQQDGPEENIEQIEDEEAEDDEDESDGISQRP